MQAQFEDWKTRPYIHGPEYNAAYDKLIGIDERRWPAPAPYHDDWKSGG